VWQRAEPSTRMRLEFATLGEPIEIDNLDVETDTGRVP
jgi:hypothetical protein